MEVSIRPSIYNNEFGGSDNAMATDMPPRRPPHVRILITFGLSETAEKNL